MTIRVGIIDDHPLFRAGVARSLSEWDGFEIVGEGSSADDARQLAEASAPDILLLDISMPGGGLEAASTVLARHPSLRVVMLTVSEKPEDITRAITAGVSGYVLKGVGSRALADILRSIAAGESYVSPSLAASLVSSLAAPKASVASVASLTGREREVLGLVAQGYSNKRIGLRLKLHEKTVKSHLSRIFAKLEVSNRTEAAMIHRDAAERMNGLGVIQD